MLILLTVFVHFSLVDAILNQIGN